MKQESKIVVAMKSGFTLVELLVVVSILGILATVAVMNFGGLTEGAQQQACETSMDTIKQACTSYKTLNKARAPKSFNDLFVKNKKGHAALEERYRNDPWGNEFKLEFKDGEPIVKSAGPDGQWSTADDLSSDKIGVDKD